MLKSLGVDQLTLKDRLSSMDHEKAQHYEIMYHRHLNAVVKRSDEAHACEQYLIGQNFSQTIEDELTGQLPFNEADFEKYNGGPQGPFYSEPPCLLDIAENSPLHKNQILAQIALIRCGKAGATLQEWGKALSRLKENCTLDDTLSWESALIYGHWRLRLGPIGSSVEIPQRAIDIALAVLQNNTASVYKPWAALTLFSFRTKLSETDREQVNHLVEKAVSSTDDELALSAAVATGQKGPLLKAIEDNDDWRQLVAALALANANASELLPYLENFSGEILIKIISRCSCPAPSHWQSTLLKLAKKQPEPVKLLRLGHITLSENDALDLSSFAVAKNDKDLMAYLLDFGCEDPRTISNGISLIFEPKFSKHWYRLSKRIPLNTIDFSRVTNEDSDSLTVLAQLSRIQVEEHRSEDFYRHSIQRMLSDPFGDTLDYWADIVLLAAKLDSDRFNFAPQTVCEYFDNADQFTKLLIDFIHRRLRADRAFSSCDNWLEGFLKTYTQDSFLGLCEISQSQFIEAMFKIIEAESLSTYLRASAASSLYPGSLSTEIRSHTLDYIHHIIEMGLDSDIRYHLDKIIEDAQ
jgi:hypothetical protein